MGSVNRSFFFYRGYHVSPEYAGCTSLNWENWEFKYNTCTNYMYKQHELMNYKCADYVLGHV